MGRVKEGVTEEQVTDLINAETWMTAEEAKEIFDVQIEERPAVAACVGWMMENFKKAPEGIKTQSVRFEIRSGRFLLSMRCRLLNP